MTTLSAIYEDFLFEIRHNLLEPFASCQLGSVFPSSCLLAKSGKQSRDAFTGSVLRFADGSLWVTNSAKMAVTGGKSAGFHQKRALHGYLIL